MIKPCERTPNEVASLIGGDESVCPVCGFRPGEHSFSKGGRMKVVWKYAIPIEDEFTIEMPSDAQILKIDVQAGEPQLWILVDALRINTKRYFKLVSTGHPFDDNGYWYVGTLQLLYGAAVFHLFEKVAA